MNARDIRRYEMLVRVRDFGSAQSDLFPASTLGGQAFATVAASVAAVSQHVAAALSGHSSVARTSKAVAAREQDAGEETSAAARAAFETAMDEALAAVQRLDAIVVNRLRHDRATLAVWKPTTPGVAAPVPVLAAFGRTRRRRHMSVVRRG